MHHGTGIAGADARRRRWAGPASIVIAAFAVASAAAAWMDESWISDSVAAIPPSTASTDSPASRIRESFLDLGGFSVHQEKPRSSGSDIKLQVVNVSLPQVPTTESWDRVTPNEPAQQVVAAAVPVPRPRPSEAKALPLPGDGDSAHTEDPTLLEKLSGMFRYRLTLASLTPNDGIFAAAPDLAARGYDGQTAVYDISARVVYLPDGSKLEAHSGLGEKLDDPRYVSQRSVGATPPAVYELKPREQLFHGVQALRMLPVEGSALGRTGLLVHTYMLGPNGDSNGCVSVKDYDKFLAAYQKGDIKRLAVVPNLAAGGPTPTRQSSL